MMNEQQYSKRINEPSVSHFKDVRLLQYIISFSRRKCLEDHRPQIGEKGQRRGMKSIGVRNTVDYDSHRK